MSEMRDVGDIVEQYLVDHGYDGLVEEDDECACEVGSLFACCHPSLYCRPGHKVPCDCGEHDFHLIAGKRPQSTGGEG